MLDRGRMWMVVAALASVCGCGGAQPTASGPDGADDTSGGEPLSDPEIPVTPQEEGPPELTEAETKLLKGPCFPMENDMYEAGKEGILVLDTELAGGEDSAAAEATALGAAMAKLEGKGADVGERDACLAAFEKQMKRRLFDHEPAERPARETLDACVRRVVASFGKKKTTFDLGGGPADVPQGPFCPDDFPVPMSLADLPYTSKGEDWESPAWKCLAFGLRTEQPFQIEYSAPLGERTFQCITRFLPRHGGAPIELVRSGTIDDGGELLVEKNSERRRMTAR